jgi:hypothetical protein
MPCPFFEPLRVVASTELRNARLPLIDEYAGRCLNLSEEAAEARGFHCNHGYAHRLCQYFPETGKHGANRYSLLSRKGEQLELLLIYEEEYSPAGKRLLHFSIATNALIESDLQPAVAAQASAFCRSFLKKNNATALHAQ